MSQFVLIDLSSIAHPIWHMSQSEPDPNTTSTRTVARVRALASGHDHVAVCCDSGRSFRRDIDANYKAQRPESDARLHHQITLARETLVNDGFPVWAAKGFEADDLIATATRRALEIPGSTVLVVSSDKDLLSLVSPRVSAKSLRTGLVIDEAGVIAKYGVKPDQMTDWLSLVGDASDNVKGAKGIGPKGATGLLFKFGDIETLYAKLAESDPQALGLKPSEATSLEEFATRRETVRSLIALRTDVEIPFDEILKERVPLDAEMTMEEEPMTTESNDAMDAFRDASAPAEPAAPPPQTEQRVEVQPDGKATVTEVKVQTTTTEPARTLLDDVVAATPTDWKLQLDPRSMDQARKLSDDLFRSRMFSAYGTPQAILSTILMGRSLGLDAMASLRGIFNVEGRHCLSAQLMVAIILKSGMAEYFRPVEISDTSATYETLRKGANQKPFHLTHTLEMARVAGVVKPKSNWEKSPVDMLCARASSRLARLIYADLLFGLYTNDEVEEFGR